MHNVLHCYSYYIINGVGCYINSKYFFSMFIFCFEKNLNELYVNFKIKKVT